MTKQTTNLNLNKPDMADQIALTISQLGSNFDIIDASLAEKAKQHWYDVTDKQFGAKGDGTSDDTVSIQSALDYAGQNGGGIVFLPKGIFKIQPQIKGEDAALYIRYNNITLLGAGRDQTQLSFYTFGGSNPNTNFYLVSSAVWRGHGIEITGGTNQGTTRKNIRILDLELNGNANYTGTQLWPADTTTGDGWDITNKGICIKADQWHDNIKIERCHIHHFKGELIYGGGANIGRVFLLDSEVHDTNGDCWSVTGQCTVKRNELYKACHAAIEDAYKSAPCFYSENYIHDIDHNGISLLLNNGAEPFGHVIVEYNLFVNNPRNGILLSGVRNLTVRKNIFIDCGQDLSTASPTDFGAYAAIFLQNRASTSDVLQNTWIYDNQIYAENKTVQHGLSIFSGKTLGAKGVYVHDNYCGLTDLGVSNTVTMQNGFTYDATAANFAPNCKFWNNINDGTTFGYTNQSQAKETLLTTTSDTIIVKQRPSGTPVNKMVLVYFRVVNAATNVTIMFEWYDASGNAQYLTVINNVSQAVGSHTLNPVFINAQGANEAQYIKVHVTAGTTNNVYVSAAIQDVHGL
jgi:hypothetical protein